MGQFGEVPVELPQGNRIADAVHGIVAAEGLDIPTDGFSKVGDGLFFGRTLAVGREIGEASGESAFVGIWDKFHRDQKRFLQPFGAL